MSDKLYDFLRLMVEPILPAVGALYFALADIWGLPMAEQIVGTLTALTAFLGVIVRISNEKYKRAQVEVNCEQDEE